MGLVAEVGVEEIQGGQVVARLLVAGDKCGPELASCVRTQRFVVATTVASSFSVLLSKYI